jgi:hypothetical protein
MKVLFGVQDWIVENPQAMWPRHAMNADAFRPEDRLAAVVSASALKNRSRVVLGAGQRQALISTNAPEIGLRGYSGLRSKI